MAEFKESRHLPNEPFPLTISTHFTGYANSDSLSQVQATTTIRPVQSPYTHFSSGSTQADDIPPSPTGSDDSNYP